MRKTIDFARPILQQKEEADAVVRKAQEELKAEMDKIPSESEIRKCEAEAAFNIHDKGIRKSFHFAIPALVLMVVYIGILATAENLWVAIIFCGWLCLSPSCVFAALWLAAWRSRRKAARRMAALIRQREETLRRQSQVYRPMEERLKQLQQWQKEVHSWAQEHLASVPENCRSLEVLDFAEKCLENGWAETLQGVSVLWQTQCEYKRLQEKVDRLQEYVLEHKLAAEEEEKEKEDSGLGIGFFIFSGVLSSIFRSGD